MFGWLNEFLTAAYPAAAPPAPDSCGLISIRSGGTSGCALRARDLRRVAIGGGGTSGCSFRARGLRFIAIGGSGTRGCALGTGSLRRVAIGGGRTRGCSLGTRGLRRIAIRGSGTRGCTLGTRSLRRLVLAGCCAGGSRLLARVAGLSFGLFSAMRAFRPFSARRFLAARFCALTCVSLARGLLTGALVGLFSLRFAFGLISAWRLATFAVFRLPCRAERRERKTWQDTTSSPAPQKQISESWFFLLLRAQKSELATARN